jgi:clan AA aspartic protease (TIGR02281 family)
MNCLRYDSATLAPGAAMRKTQQTHTNSYGLASVIRSLFFLILFLSVPVILLNVMSVDQPRERDSALKPGDAIPSENRLAGGHHSQSEEYPFLTAFSKISDFISATFSYPAATSKKNSMEKPETSTQPVAPIHKSRHQNNYDIIIGMSPRGSFLIDGFINKTSVLFIVDTGASVVAIPSAIAKASGLIPGQASQAITPSDVYTVYRTIVPALSFGNITLQNVPAIINPLAPDDQVLLGMSALQYLTVHHENRQMVLSPQGVSTSTGENGSQIFKRSVQQCNDSGSDQIIINERVLACMKGN